MAHRRVTLADVARRAGVSSPTASLVLSGRGVELRISESVRQRVQEVASELGYRPNIVSRGLRRGSTQTLGFVSDTVATSQLAGDLIKGALEAAHDRGFMLFIGETEGDPELERGLLDAMHDRQVDGIVLASMSTGSRAIPAGLDAVPAVLLNAFGDDDRSLPTVVPDEISAGRSAAQLLLDAGHRRIHLVGAGPTPDQVFPGTVAGRERLAGILEALSAAGVAVAGGHLFEDWLPEHGYDATRQILAAGGCDAIITFNDRLAFGAYQALQEAGLRVPDDVSIVSFDDHPLADWLRPGLTTFAIPHYDLGRRAVERLLEVVAARSGAGEPPHGVERLPMPLRRRGSVAVVDPAEARP